MAAPLDDDTLNGTHETYVLGTPIDGYVDEVGYEYKICWGHNPQSVADFSSAFRYTI